jgi:hypothetical protein
MNLDYVICIPSYKRHEICKNKTLSMLKNNDIDSKKIYIYVADENEYEIYSKTLDTKSYNKIIIGKRGLVQQREFIMNQWPEGKWIVFLDDDIKSIDLSLSPLFKKHNFNYFIKYAFDKCVANDAYIWGVYPVFNIHFRAPTPEMSTDLKYIVGAFYGIINRPTLNSLKLIITRKNGQKEDVERSIKYFIQDKIVLRFNRVGFVTQYYGREGGLGNYEERLKPMQEACKKLIKKYPEYGYSKKRKKGMCEVGLRKIHAFTMSNKPEISKNKTRKYNKKVKSKKV